MEITGDYHGAGYAQVRSLIPPEVARAFLVSLKQDIGSGPIDLSRANAAQPILKQAAYELYGPNYKPMLLFLWGLTPAISQIVGRELLPTYNYFRIYRKGDVCRVHSDRPSCEHSVSLTLAYSDDAVWPLEVGNYRTPPGHPIAEDFGQKPYSSLEMQPGDAVVYQGLKYPHGRITPNPNAWSAHLFLHYVDANGPFVDLAFDRKLDPAPVDFSFA